MILSKSKIIKRYAVQLDEAVIIPVSKEDQADDDTDLDEAEIAEEQESEEPEIKSERRNRQERERQERERREEAILVERERELEKERIRNEVREQAGAQAQRTTDLIINHTLEKAKSELDGAISQGYADGFEAGRNEAMGIIGPALDKISVLAEAITGMQDEMLENFKDKMFDMVAGISQKILKREIDENDGYLLVLFEEALEDIKAESFVNVTVSESQAEFALREIDLFRAKVANIEDFKIIADKNAERGTMVVETAKAVADASFAVQMDEINAVLDRMKENISVSAAGIMAEG